MATFASGRDSCELTALVDQQASGVILRRGIIDARALVISRDHELEFEFYRSPLGNPIITRENPFISPDELDHLDESGVVLVGTVVRGRATAVSVLRPSTSSKKVKPGHRLFSNDSCEIPAELDGYQVVSVHRESILEPPSDSEPGIIERIKIGLRRYDNLTVGDHVSIGDETLTVTKIIDDESMPLCSSGGPADILLPSFSYAAEQATTNKEFRVSIRRTIPTATELLRARSTGLYSLISLQPLRSRDLGSQRVSASQIHWLHQNGFVQLASEFASLKSDDTKNRPLLQRISEGEPAGCLNVEISGPESLFVLVEELRALGLEVLLNHHTDHVSLHMQPASLELIRRTAAAQVKKPETIHYRTYLPQPDGLFCERSFGPESRYRRRTAAHILLSHPIVPPIFRVGSNPILCRALELDAETIESILAHRLGLTPNGQLDKVNVKSELPTGAVAIGQLLNDRVEPRFPWSQHLVQSFVYVTPPDLRPLVLLDNGNFATSDLNEFYRLVINRNNRLSKLLELNAPRTIINSETYELQCMVDQLHMNGRFHSPTMGDHARPLVSVFDLVLGHLCETEYKHQDYSAAARLIVDSSIPVDRCLIPTQIFQTLRLSQDEPVLLSIGEIIVARYPNCSDEPVIRISETTAEQLRVCNSQVISVFRPLTGAGVREAISLAYSSTQFAYTELPLLTPSEISDQLIEHIASDQDLSLVGPQWLIVGGTGSTQCAGDAELPREHQQQIEIPIT